MDLSRVNLTDRQREFAAEAREFFSVQVTPDVLARERRTGDGFSERVHLALGSRGWIMPGWPAERGGAGLDPVQQRILELEAGRSRMPFVTLGTTRMVTEAVERHASDEIRPGLLRGVAAGTTRFCLGYSEPDGGSDIAAARVRAVRDGDDWVINGAKIFTTGAHNCQYTFLITRTDPDLPKHQGLTMFLVPLAAPGVQIQPIRTYGGERTNVVYYGDVRVADAYRLGAVNGGWPVLRGPLDSEHGLGGEAGARRLADLTMSRGYVAELARALEVAVQWATTPRPDGTRPADDPYVRYRLGQVEVDIQAAMCTPGPLGRVKASDALVRGAAALMDLLGPQAVICEGTEGAPGGGRIEFAHRFAQGTATYGGTVEVFRGIIAQHVLGLPRPSYPGSKVLAGSARGSQPPRPGRGGDGSTGA
jgi:alkylation response protein AidB-like acyl-CoA dehydrogenase